MHLRTLLLPLGALLCAEASFAQAAPPPAGAAPGAPAPAPAKPAEAPPPAAERPAPATRAPSAEETEGGAAAEKTEGAAPEAAPPLLPPAGAPPSDVGLLPGLHQPGAPGSALPPAGPRAEEAAPKAADDVFAEDWWSNARPILELHGYFRVRGELFHHFSLGRVDPPGTALWPRPTDNRYTPITEDGGGQEGEATMESLCTEDESGLGDSEDATTPVSCINGTQSMANVRFRLTPEIHVSDNLRVVTQIDLLDNLVLGSTPAGYSNQPSSDGYSVRPRSGYTPIGFYDDTTAPPRSGVNGFGDSIAVKRAWAEYSTPVGEVRFGRMPNHWGLGMVYHSGDGYDDDYQSTVDRIQFVAGIKPLELYVSGAWDFPNEGPTSDNISRDRAQPYDVAQLDDVDQYVFSVARKKSPELERLALARGDLVVNGGVQVTYRDQLLSNDMEGACGNTTSGGAALGCSQGGFGYVRRDAYYVLPDLWLQLLYRKFRFEAEVATVQGSIENPTADRNPNIEGDDGYHLRQWGLVAEIEQKLAEDRLHLGFGFGWASGDQDVDGLIPTTDETLSQIGGDRDVETFRFNPSYRLDLILFKNILSRVQGAYYFRPNLRYDLMREPSGQRIGGHIAAIWSRASEFIQAPGHERDLGIELNAALDFQSKDGALNDDPNEMGGFYARLEYGVLFPMGGLGYPDGLAAVIESTGQGRSSTQSAQTLRLYLGVLF